MLARQLGATVAELQDRITYAEFIEWAAFFVIEANHTKGRLASPTGAPPRTGSEMAARLRLLTEGL